MAQADGNVENGNGSAVRADINANLTALFTNNSGPNEPATTFANQTWVDTNNQVLKLRNTSNNAFTSMRTLDGRVILPNGTDALPSLFFSNNTNTGIRYDSSVGSLAFLRNGLKHAVFGRTLEGQTNAWCFGPCAGQSTSIAPTNGNNGNKNSVCGVTIQDDGPVHIGTKDSERPLTVNKMGDYGGGNDSGAGSMMNFNTNGQFRGKIEWNGSNISLTTSSDYRLKDNVVELTGAIDRIKSARPVRFNYTWDDSCCTVDGFIAHEIGEVVPEMLFGIKDALDDDGEIEPQGINTQGLVPLLTAALKEAIGNIEALEARVAALEGN